MQIRVNTIYSTQEECTSYMEAPKALGVGRATPKQELVYAAADGSPVVSVVRR